MGAILAQITALTEQAIASKMQAAANVAAEQLEWEMKNSIQSIVYGLGISGELPRTGAFGNSWIATGTATGLSAEVKLEYQGQGYHPSVVTDADVTGSLDEIIKNGSGSAVISAANAGRDYFTPVDQRAPEIVREAFMSAI